MKILIDGQTLNTPEFSRGIGVVWQNLCKELAIKDVATTWYLLTPKKKLPKVFRLLQKKGALIPIEYTPPPLEWKWEKRTAFYAKILSEVIEKWGITIYWNPNPLMLNVIYPGLLHGVFTVVTIHDLIPIVMAKRFLDKWSAREREEYLWRLEGLPDWCDKLIFVSESSKNDYVSRNQQVSSKAVVIYNGIDPCVFHESVNRSKSAPYILFVGGFDPRKNISGALRAFAQLVKEEGCSPQLRFVLLCVANKADRRAFFKEVKHLGLTDRVELTGFVKEKELGRWYREASVCFFPSFYEGFGFPVVEAMASGIPVLASRNSSILEIGKELIDYCDPFAIDSMKKGLQRVLERKVLLKEKWIRRARDFRWDKSAAEYVRVFDELGKITVNEPPKIAMVSPWPPQPSGIADYTFELVSALRKSAEVTVYTPGESFLCLEGVRIRLLKELKSGRETTICHLGNNARFHNDIYRFAWENPVYLVLHDYNIHPFMEYAYWKTSEEKFYYEALVEGYGKRGEREFARLKRGKPVDLWKYPMSHAIVARSLGVIVHSRSVAALLQPYNVCVIPHGGTEEEGGFIPEKKEKFTIGVFGSIHENKRWQVILNAFKRLHKKGYPVALLFVGQVDAIDAKSFLKECQKVPHCTCTDFVSLEQFHAYLQAVDVVVNLRFPSMMESSGPLMKAFSRGKACIVSNYQQFAELPDSVCWKITLGYQEERQLAHYLERLFLDFKVRDELGRNAKAYVRDYCSYERVAEKYLQFLFGNFP